MATLTWDGAGLNANWSTATNWSTNAVPASGDTVNIDGGGGSNANPIISTATSFMSLTTISRGTLTVNATLTSLAVALTESGVVTITVAGSIVGDVSLNPALLGSGQLNNNGTIMGNLFVNGGTVSNAGVVAGATTVNGGTMTLGNGTNLANTQAVMVYSGTLTVNAADTVGAVTLSGGTIGSNGLLTASSFTQTGGDLGGLISSAGTKSLQGGILSGTLLGAGATVVTTGLTQVTGTITGNVTVSTGAIFVIDSATAVSGSINVASAANIFYGAGINEQSALIIGGAGLQLGVEDGVTATQSGAISSSGAFGFEKVGKGNLVLTGSNAFLGGVTVSEGTLTVAGNSALGSTLQGTLVSAGATLALQSAGLLESLTLNGSGAGGMGALRHLGGVSAVDGAISLGSDALIASDSGSLNVGSLISGNFTLTFGGSGLMVIDGFASGGTGIATGTGSVIKTGSGTLTLSATNTYTGTTTISGGTLQIGNGSTLGTLGVGEVINNAALVFNRANAMTVGNIISGTGTLTKTGAGTLTLSGVNTYSGVTTVTSGTLQVDGGAAIADTGAVVVRNGGTFRVMGAQELIGSFASSDISPATSTAVLQVDGGLAIGGAADTTFAGVINGAAQLTVQGGGTLTLTGVNTYAGTLVSSGAGSEIALTGTGAVASTAIRVLVGGTLTTDGAALASNAGLFTDAVSTVNINGSETIGSIAGNAQAAQLGSVNITSGAALTLNGSAGNSNIGGTVTGAGSLVIAGGTHAVGASGSIATAGLTLSGGTLEITGTGSVNTSSNLVTVLGGRLVTGGNGIADNDGLALGSGGALTLGGNETIASLQGTGTVNLGGNQLVLAGQAAALGAATINGSAGVGRFFVKLVPTLQDFSLAPVTFTNWAVGSDVATIEGNALANTLTGGGVATMLYGLEGGDILQGGAGNDTLDGGTGNDTLSGGLGDDTYIVDSASDRVNELLAQGSDTILSSASFNLAGIFVETLRLTGAAAIAATGNSQGNTLIGNDAANTLNGLGGADTLDGGGGNDTLDGGTGNDTLGGGLGDDTYIVDSTSDRVTELVAQGNDTIFSSVSFNLGGTFVETLQLTGAAAIAATGNSQRNTLIGNDAANTLTGLGGADTLDGGKGADTLIGGTGDDTYFVDNASDTVTELAGEGNDTVNSSASFALAAASSVETLQLTGMAAISATGSNQANTLIGNGAANTLIGLGGNDTLDGGAGNDTFSGGLGDDIYIVDSASETVTELFAQGNDTIISSASFNLAGIFVETLILTGATAIAATGNNQNNTLIGNDAANTLSGLGGADTLDGGGGNDTLDGGAGNDSLYGGLGDDTFIVDSASDRVAELFAQGNDTILSSASFNLGGTFVETLRLTGAGAIAATGNDRTNALIGNDAANTLSGLDGDDTLSGLAGNDLLDGGNGNDTLTGGTGADHFQFGVALAENADRVTDFAVGLDKLVFTGADYGLAGGAPLTAANFTVGAVAIGVTAQFIYNSAARTLSWDADGSGIGVAALVATFDTAIAIASTDFVLI